MTIPGLRQVISNRLVLFSGSVNFATIVGPSSAAFGTTNLFLSALALFIAVVLHGHSALHALRALNQASRLAGVNGHQNFLRCIHSLPTKVRATFVFKSLGNLGQIGSARNRRTKSRLVYGTTRVVISVAGRKQTFHVNNSRFLLVMTNQGRGRTTRVMGGLHRQCRRGNVDVTLNCDIRAAPVRGVSTIVSRISHGVCSGGNIVCNQHQASQGPIQR